MLASFFFSLLCRFPFCVYFIIRHELLFASQVDVRMLMASQWIIPLFLAVTCKFKICLCTSVPITRALVSLAGTSLEGLCLKNH